MIQASRHHVESIDMEAFMKTATKPSTKKVAIKSGDDSAHSLLRGSSLAGSAVLADMQAHRRQVTATPDTARDFLTRVGVLTPSGKLKQLIRA